MRDPLWQLKRLPWSILLQAASFTVLIATALDILLIFLLSLTGGFGLISLPLISLLLPFAAAVGIGALAVVLMERIYRNILLDTAVLWALVPCLVLVLILKGLIPQIPTYLVSLSYPQLVGMILGIFFKGKRHWRY